MLFSDETIAEFINEKFEPAWSSLRPVPTIKIDFHNGHVIERTLQGNIASCICAADSQVLDILPGMYTAEEYKSKLATMYIDLMDTVQVRFPDRQALLSRYHKLALEQIFRRAAAAATPTRRPMFDGSKAASQAPIKELIRPKSQPPIPKGLTDLSTFETSSWRALIEDTETNETVRREQIHKFLISGVENSLYPKDVLTWLYKAVLHADLEDPYLGLGSVLFENYPFKN